MKRPRFISCKNLATQAMRASLLIAPRQPKHSKAPARHVLTNKRTHRNMHTATEACHLYLAAAHPVRAYSMMQSRRRRTDK